MKCRVFLCPCLQRISRSECLRTYSGILGIENYGHSLSGKKIISIMMHFLHRNVFRIFNILLWEENFQDPLALRPTCLLWRSRLRYNLPWGLINWLPSLIICYSIIRLRIPYARFHWANLKRYSLKSFPSKVSCYLCTLII